MLGQNVGSYQVTGKIAEGGMGVVYRAQHALLGKSAAVKLLLPELSANHEIVNRFFNEARAASTIRHPGIIEIFDFGYLANGMAFIVMEFLDGEPLSRRLARVGRLDERTALTLLRAISGALAAAHAKGIIHRDLKPDNIFLVPDADVVGGERPKLLDFGIAKLNDAGPGAASKTRTGAVMGTPVYMSPEQCRGAGTVDARSDLYSVGCILYEMLTGRPPFTAEGVGELIASHMLYEPQRPQTLVPELSARADALCMQLLAKDPGDRLQSAQELARLLGLGSVPQIPEGTFQPQMVAPTSPRAPTGSTAQFASPAQPSHASLPPTAAMAPMAPMAPTTLSSATGLTTGVDQAPPRSRAGLFIGIGVAVAAVGVIAVLALGGGGKKPADKHDDGSGAPGSAQVGSGSNPAAAIDAGSALVTNAPPPDAAEVAAQPADAAETAAVTPDAADLEASKGSGGGSGDGSGGGSGHGGHGHGHGHGHGSGSGSGSSIKIDTEL